MSGGMKRMHDDDDGGGGGNGSEREQKRQRKEEKRRRKREKRERKERRRERKQHHRDNDGDGSDSDFRPSGTTETEEEYLPMIPKAAKQARFNFDEDDDEGGGDGDGYTNSNFDLSGLTLKSDHAMRPVYVSGDMKIFLETFSPIYAAAYDFLVAIAEPVSRPEQIHEYRLTPYALYAAVSVGLDSERIIKSLSKLCKTNLPVQVPKFIRDCTRTYGKAKLVLKKGKYLVQTYDQTILKMLLKDRVIKSCVINENVLNDQNNADADDMVIAGGKQVNDLSTFNELDRAIANERTTKYEGDEGDDDSDSDEGDVDGDLLSFADPQRQTFQFEVNPEKVEFVKRRATEIEYPLMEEYDFRNDTINRNINLDLKPKAKIRPYQEKSLEKMFGNGRARSGVIVLPCGAGKSLVGVTAACTIKKPTLCLCTSSVSVEQWRYQFSSWSTIPREDVGKFVAGNNDKSYYGGVTVTTYSMISHSGKRSKESEKMLRELKTKEWGLLLLDEVHVVPANVFRKVIGVIKAHCKLGLTATLLREDEKIGDINFLIGPKLYEANWLDLQRQNFLATVQCAEVWCPMTKEFYHEYLLASAKRKKLLYGMNPNKFRMCQYLVRFHEQRGDKTIIFSDNIGALELYGKKLGIPFIHGPTSQDERLRILQNFQHNPKCATILLSKVGDTSIDIPEANVLIQVSSHYGSRRQEAQRLGRILRPKPRAGQNFNAFFYSLVSTDTTEMFFSSKRQQFLIDQGYAFKVITQLEGMDKANLHFQSKEEQLELLKEVLATNESKAEETIDMDAHERNIETGGPGGGLGGGGWATRRDSSIGALTGGTGMRYAEFGRRNGNSNVMNDSNMIVVPKSQQVIQHPLFRKRGTK